MLNNKVAVLLAAYNGVEWIDEQLNSILAQKDIIVTIFISVDLSSDHTYEYISEKYKNENIILLPYGEKFGGAARNFYRLIVDVDFDAFDYISFSDQDDVWNNNKLACAISKLSDYDAYSSNVTAFWSDGRECLINKSQNQVEFDFLFEAAGPGCTYVFRQNIATKFKEWIIERYDKINIDIALHDWLIYAFSRHFGYRWFIDARPMMRYRQHANNQVGTNNSFSAAKKRLKLIKGKWYRNQVTKIAEHLALQNISIVKYGLNKGYIGNIYLLFHVNQLRRRPRDRIALSFALLCNIF
jgi:rhamnosyltransferase